MTKARDSSEHGLIPACAGKTLSTSVKLCPSWAHPRVCGENFGYALRAYRVVGSSPRVRGKLNICQDVINRCGLIPACAGKTC